MRKKRSGTKTTSRRKAAARPKSRKRRSPAPIDWTRVDATADKDIAEQVRRDPDDVQFTDEMLDAARWVGRKSG